LVEQYLQDQNIFAYIAPPAADFTLFQPGRTIYIPDENELSRQFMKTLLVSQSKDEYSTFLWIYEDRDSLGRELVIASDSDVELARISREQGYTSDWVVRKIYPNFDLYNTEYQNYLAAIFDPGRVVMQYKVIVGEANLLDYIDLSALARLEAMAAPVMMAMSSQVTVTNLIFTSIEPKTNNTVELTIGWPDSGLATNKLEIFTCENLNTGLWSIADVETIDLSTNRHVWVDDDGYTNRQSRFYECWLLNDDDGDGISDGRETRLYFTNINTNDSDGDGIGDYVEIFESVYTNTTFSTISYGTNPNEVDSDGDGLTDKEEREYGTDPWRSDSDGDESDDFDEVNNFYLFAWGVNENISSFYIPVAEPLALSSYHTDGSKALCLNEEGGVSEFRTWRTYVAPPEFATNFIAVAAGASHRSAITDSGALVSWWSGADEPMQNENFEAPVEQVACGWGHTVALLTNKSVRSYYYYGYSYAGQTNQPLGMAAAEAVAAGNKHSLALLDDGHVVAWGRNYHGQTNVPVNVTNAVAIAAGENHSAALLDDGSVVVWGDDSDNQVTHAALATNAVQLACGKNNCIILRWDNTVFAWGDGCGDGDKTNLVFETPVLAVRAGGYGCAVILENGETFMVNVRQPDYLRVKDCQTIGNGSAAALAATNPIDPDTDGDTLPDKWEIENGLNPFSDYDTIAPYNNADNDDLTNLQEYQYGTHPLLSDTDDDGIDDDDEVNGPTDPLNPDSDFDNLKDGDERLYGTDPMIPDCDGDTLLDGDEINIHKSSPLHVDSDNDGLYDQEEVNIYFTTPGHPDTDDDGLPDPWELYFGFNPLVWDDSSIDSDGDGLTNKEEANIYTITRSASPMTMGLSSAVAMSIPLDLGFGWSLTGLSPFLADSDWDGTLDSHDVDPLDYLRRDVANDNNTVKTTLQVGDPSASHSEKYAISVGPYRVHMPHVNNSSYMFEATYSVPRGQTFSGAVTSLYDDDDDGDYAAYVIGSGFTITPSGVLGDYDDTGFNAGSKSFTVTTPDATPADTAADSASKDPDKANKADPVNAISGNVTITRTDAVLNCPGVPLTFGRYYNSSTLFGGGPLGPGWSHSYEIRLGGDETNTIYKAISGTIRRVYLPDGQVYAFSYTNGIYTAADDIELNLESYGVDQWCVSRPGGFEWIFDADGRILSMDDGQGNTLTLSYLLTSVTNWLDASTPVGISFNYDWQMNNLTVINPMGYAIETYTLDAQERVERVTNLEDQQLDVTYLVGGLISSIDRFDGVLVSNIFDIAGNIVETLHDGTSIEQASYRKNGQLLSISNAYATCVYSHDTRGFVTNVTQSTGNNLQSSVGYAFDPAGNTTNVLWNVGSGTLNVAYGYDEAERLALQSDSAGEFAYTYNPYNGALGALSNDNITVDYTFDILDAVTNVVYRDGTGNEIASFDYKHDVLGLITQKVSVINGIATTNSYIFDNMGRLLSEHTNPNPQTPNPVSYTYDLAGNRLTAGSSTYTYTHNKLDGVHHDVAGNITKMVQNGIMLDMNWNSRGQLTSVSTNGVFTESYTWGPLGNRLSTTDARGTTYHAYDGAHCIADYNSSGDLIASYTWGSGVDNLLAVTVYGNGSTNKYYAIKDHLGSVHALIDEFCNTVMTVTYNAWGTPLNSSLSLQNSSFLLRYLFQGREYSHATGLYNFRARWYDSNIGRWLSKDPVGLEGGLNFYVFCGNDPVNFVDPWGECEIEIGFIDELASVLSEPIDIALSKIGTAIGTIRNSILGEPELDPNETPVFEPGRPQFLTGDDLMDLAYLAMTRSGGKPPSGNSKATSQAAAKLGYNRRIPPQKAPFSSHGKPAYQKGNRYITPDADSHKGGAWKKFDNKGRRMGTYDANLKTRIGN